MILGNGKDSSVHWQTGSPGVVRDLAVPKDTYPAFAGKPDPQTAIGGSQKA
jgi:hypothetical protein